MRAQSHIIIVDDDPLIRPMLVRLFTQTFPAARITTATSAAEALALYREHGADLIISDYTMPPMNGPELTTALRAAGATVPIVILSSGSDRTAECLTAGATAFFPKHGAFPEVIAIVDALLSV